MCNEIVCVCIIHMSLEFMSDVWARDIIVGVVDIQVEFILNCGVR